MIAMFLFFFHFPWAFPAYEPHECLCLNLSLLFGAMGMNMDGALWDGNTIFATGNYGCFLFT